MSDRLQDIIQRIASREYSEVDIVALQQALDREHDGSKLGKYNVNIGEGQNIHIGDRTYVSWSDEAIQALIQAIRADQSDTSKANAPRPQELCRDRQTLDQYLDGALNRLKQQGCLDIQQNVMSDSQYFNYVARISDFELPFGPLSTRGEAIFLFSEFASLTMPILQQFSGECLQWASGQVNPKAAGQALYNFRVPMHFCFAIALVDQLDTETKAAIQTTNPIDRRVDILWYEVPVVYGLSDNQLYYYSEPANFFDHFKGEIAWKQIRPVIQQLLSPSSDQP
ncbi:hypothetical protein VB780_03210 [Leptolyngbya sp. CCNP1308]|uniref:hypothetical protein n=1 Tax=Leptolyngbya sp. CCNP1308 TaxID=3110255 RepID=UPI002B1F21B3|nr:hypothetical protein [Leptolyngbya sp. CCNP1308]MEA5447563.1 hypothetical protein [Leptolyngbya sp. CCNP1308]